MKKKFLFFALVCSTITLFSCGGSEEKKRQDGTMPAPDTSKGVSAMAHDSLSKGPALVYVCPCGGCPEVKESKPGNCPKCSMELKAEKK